MLAREEDEQPAGDGVVDRVEQSRDLHRVAQPEQRARAEERDDAVRRGSARQAGAHVGDEVVEERRERRLQQFRILEVVVAVSVARHPRLERRRDVDERPGVAVLVRGRLERRQVQAEPALVLGRIDGHPHPLGRRQVLLPGSATNLR